MLRQERHVKGEAMSMGPNHAFAMMAAIDGFGDTFAYTMRSVREESGVAKEFLEHMVDDAKVYVAGPSRPG